MEKVHPLKRSLSWFLARLGARNTKASDALRKSISERDRPQLPSAVIADREELDWTCR
ncbi:MAG: hypothetical protein HY928_06110 [Elusimicrobia bacterium]|nr:hypothetical protein [Elusimicrobiota bacterium]